MRTNMNINLLRGAANINTTPPTKEETKVSIHSNETMEIALRSAAMPGRVDDVKR